MSRLLIRDIRGLDDRLNSLAESAGAQGPEGPQGPAGPAGADGEAGPAGSDATVTREAVEAVLTGEITSHTHPGGAGLTHPQVLARTLGA